MAGPVRYDAQGNAILPAPFEGFANFSQGAAGLTNLFTGLFGTEGSQSTSGTQKTSGTTSLTGTTTQDLSQLSPEALAMLQQVFPQIFSQLTSGDYSKQAAIKDSQGIIAQVMKDLREQVLPQIYGGESKTGGYSSTAKALLSNDAAARAAGQAASLVSDVAVKYGGVQSAQSNSLVNLINAAVNANKQQTGTSVQNQTQTQDALVTTDQTQSTETEGLLKHVFGW